MNEVITKEKATAEVDAWLNYKRIKPTQRELYKTNIETLVEAVQYGDITINANTFAITHKLTFPVDGLFDSLEYKARCSGGEFSKASKNAATSELAQAYIAALTGKGLSLIQRMDSEDLKIGNAIVVFFI